MSFIAARACKASFGLSMINYSANERMGQKFDSKTKMTRTAPWGGALHVLYDIMPLSFKADSIA
eukprot:2129219-Amphidinium_carterae.3